MNTMSKIVKIMDGMKTNGLVLANGGLVGYMVQNPDWTMPSWMILLDLVLFAGAFRSAMRKKPGVK